MATFRGTSSADTIFGSASADSITGDAGNDFLVGGAGNDTISGGAGDDSIHGGAGNDRIAPGTNFGFDYLRASRGSDTYDFGGVSAGSYYEIDYSSLGGGVRVALNSRSGSVLKNADRSTDTILNLSRFDGDVSGLTIIGSVGNDTMTAASGTDIDLTFYGFHGNDVLTGSSNTFDRIRFTDRGDGARVTVSRSVGSEMTGTAVDEFGDTDRFSNINLIEGTRFADVFTGSSGNDSFRPRQGNDTINGGAGFDLVRYNNSSQADRAVVDLQTGVATLGWNGVTETDRLTSIERFRGTGGNDTLRGAAASERLQGDGGSDLIIGRAGNDTLQGEGGADTVQGDAGNDLIEGGAENDRLTGGAGADRFEFSDADGRDTITDFQDRSDRIVIDDGATAFSQVRVTDSGANVLISFAATAVTLLNVDHRLITAADFEFV